MNLIKQLFNIFLSKGVNRVLILLWELCIIIFLYFYLYIYDF